MKYILKSHSGSILAILLMIYSFHSCTKETLELDKLSKDIVLSPEVMVKIAHGTLDFGNVLDSLKNMDFESGDSAGIEILPDNSLRFVWDTTFTSIDILEIYDVPDRMPETGVKTKNFITGNLRVDDFSLIKSVSLDSLTLNFPPLVRAGFVTLDGTTSVFPAVTGLPGGSFTMDPVPNYINVWFSSGILGLTVTNNLPVAISTLSIILKDENDSIVAALDYNDIPANGGSETQTSDLANRGPFTNQFTFEITSFTTEGSAPGTVPISLQDDLVVEIFSQDIIIGGGTAVLPDQLFVYDTSSLAVDAGADQKLYKIILSSGKINYQVSSTFNEDVNVKIKMPGTTIDGDTVAFDVMYLAGTGTTSGTIDLSNSVTDLTTDPSQPFNTFPFQYVLGIVSSDNLITFSSTDQIDLEFYMDDIELRYLEGYFGYFEETFDGDTIEIQLEDLDKITGTFQLSNPVINFNYSNSFGIPIALDLDMKASFESDPMVDLGASRKFIQSPADTINPMVEGIISYNKDNSNIEDLLVFPPPAEISFSGAALVNPDQDTTAINFITGISSLGGDLEIIIPAEFRAQDFAFVDTMEVDFDDDIPAKSGTLHLNVRNGFPIDLSFSLTPLDSLTGDPYTPVVFTLLSAAPVDTDGIVDTTQVEFIEETVEVNETFFEDLKNSDRIAVKATLNTSNGDVDDVKILSTYTLEFNIAIRVAVDYEISDNN